jgi:GH43 family beta-xylosidase
VYNAGQVSQAIEQSVVSVWDTSDEKRTGGPGHTSYTTYIHVRPIVLHTGQ